MSNIKETKDGLVEKSSGRKIESPLDTLNEFESSNGVQSNINCGYEKSKDTITSMQSAISSLAYISIRGTDKSIRKQCTETIEVLHQSIVRSIQVHHSLKTNLGSVK